MVSEGDVFLMQPYQATLAVLEKRRRRKKSGDGEGGGEESSSASETEALTDGSADSLAPHSDSDGRCSLCSTADSAVEDGGGSGSDVAPVKPQPTEAEEDMESEAAEAAPEEGRAAAHTRTHRLVQ